MKIRFSNFIFLILVAACIDPYTGLVQYRPMLVIQGLITDKPGPYLISISRTIPFELQSEVPAPISATVKITDSNGYSEDLIEKSTGNFYTQHIQGTVGTSYFITVTTTNGNVYESAVEKMLPVNNFSLRSEFVMNVDSLDQRVDSSMRINQVSKANGFNILLKTSFLPEQEGRVWWRGTGTWHIMTYPGSRRGAFGKTDTPDCAGILTGRCTCCDCWITEYNGTPLIMDNQRVMSVNDLKVWFVVANRRTLYDRYHLEIEQLSLSAEVYEFWKSVKITQSNSSNLFQIPPPKTRGNIKALSANSMPVIGYFAASSSKTISIDFTRSDVPYKIYDIDIIKQSCLDIFTYDLQINHITNEKPLFW